MQISGWRFTPLAAASAILHGIIKITTQQKNQCCQVCFLSQVDIACSKMCPTRFCAAVLASVRASVILCLVEREHVGFCGWRRIKCMRVTNFYLILAVV